MGDPRNKPAFDINDLVKNTYTKIAEWHNEEATAESLKHLSFDIVSTIIADSYKHLDLKVDFDLGMDDAAREKLETEKANRKKRMGVNDLDNLSDEELLREIAKRKKPNTPNGQNY